MYDYVKPIIRQFSLNHIILHVESNKLKSSKTASQISRSVSDLALSLKSETNTVTISPIVPRKNNLDNKQQDVNSRLIHMCSERDLTFVYHTDSNDYEKHLNGSKVHLNKSETTEFAKNVWEFLFQQDWYSADNSGNIALGSEESSTVLELTQYLSIRIITNYVDQIFFITLVINLYGKIQFLKNHEKFHQILIEELSLIRVKLWKYTS